MRSRNDLPGLLRDLDHELVREQPRAAGDGGAVAAGLADHGRRLAGDRRLVDRADALDDLAVGRDHVAGLDDDDVAAAELGRRHLLEPPLSCAGARRSSCASRAARSPAPCRGPRRSPRRSSRRGRSARARRRRAGEPERLVSPPNARLRKKMPVVIDAAELDDEHDRVAQLDARVELRERVPDRRERRSPREKRPGCVGLIAAVSLSSARLSSSTLTPGLAEEAERRPSVLLVDQRLHRSRAAAGARRRCARACSCAFAGEMSRVDARGGRRDRVHRDVADRQARVVRALELQDRAARCARTSFARSGLVGPRLAKVVAGGVVGRRRRRRPRVEVARRRELLRGEPRADDLAVALDEAAVRLVAGTRAARSRS